MMENISDASQHIWTIFGGQSEIIFEHKHFCHVTFQNHAQKILCRKVHSVFYEKLGLWQKFCNVTVSTVQLRGTWP